MKNNRLTFGTLALTAIALLSAPITSFAQRWSDDVQINLTNPVTMGEKTLQPGNYTIKQMDMAGGDLPVLVIRGENNTRVQAEVKVTPALQNRTQPETRVLFYHVGSNYYFDTIWVKGWAYGFKFMPPKGVKASKDSQ